MFFVSALTSLYFTSECHLFLLLGGAARFSVLNENVTHVILDRPGGEPDRSESEFFQLLEMKGWSPLVVSPEWLIESARQGMTDKLMLDYISL